MTRVSATLASDTLLTSSLGGVNDQLSTVLRRLSTLRRVERGRDDPAGLIAAEALRSELVSTQRAIEATSRTAATINVADSALLQVSGLVRDIRGHSLAIADGSLSDAENQAHQLEIDAALEAIDRIGASTKFAGRELLTGDSLVFLLGTDPGETTELTLPDVNTASLASAQGGLSALKSGGSAAPIDGDAALAVNIADAAASEIRLALAKEGAFLRGTVDNVSQALDQQEIELLMGISRIVDVDVAVAAAELTRTQILAESLVLTIATANDLRGTSANALLGR